MKGGVEMIKNKEALLLCAENAAQYLNEIGGGKFIAFILDIIDFVERQNKSSQQKTQQLCEILYNVKHSNIEILGGGKSIKNSYVQFIDEFLKITKTQNGYKIANHDFKDLTIDELHYVFAWIRRLVKEQSERTEQSDRSHSRGREKYRENQSNSKADTREHKDKKVQQAGNRKVYETDSKGLLNTQLADQLGALYKGNK
jgi:hypothetical protein